MRRSIRSARSLGSLARMMAAVVAPSASPAMMHANTANRSTATVNFQLMPALRVEIAWLCLDDPRSPDVEHAPGQSAVVTYGRHAESAITGWFHVADGTENESTSCTGRQVSIAGTHGTIPPGDPHLATDLLGIDGSTDDGSTGVAASTSATLTLDQPRTILSAAPTGGRGPYIMRAMIHVSATCALPGTSTVELVLTMTGEAPV